MLENSELWPTEKKGQQAKVPLTRKGSPVSLCRIDRHVKVELSVLVVRWSEPKLSSLCLWSLCAVIHFQCVGLGRGARDPSYEMNCCHGDPVCCFGSSNVILHYLAQHVQETVESLSLCVRQISRLPSLKKPSSDSVLQQARYPIHKATSLWALFLCNVRFTNGSHVDTLLFFTQIEWPFASVQLGWIFIEASLCHNETFISQQLFEDQDQRESVWVADCATRHSVCTVLLLQFTTR